MRAETGTHSANCAADRRDSSGAALGPVLDMPVIVQRGAQFVCRGRRLLCRGADADSCGPFVQKVIEIPQLQYFYVVDVPVVQVHLGSSSPWTRSVIVNDMCNANSEGASNSAHRPLLWTFRLCNTDGFDASSFFGYGGDEGVFRGFSAFFALLRVVPELSASFRSPRALTPVSARRLLHNFMLRVC